MRTSRYARLILLLHAFLIATISRVTKTTPKTRMMTTKMPRMLTRSMVHRRRRHLGRRKHRPNRKVCPFVSRVPRSAPCIRPVAPRHSAIDSDSDSDSSSASLYVWLVRSSAGKEIGDRHTSSPGAPPKKVQPPCWKKS